MKLADYGLQPGDLTELKRLFEHATTFGSLIQVPEGLAAKLPALKQLSEATSQDLFVSEALKRLRPLVQQAELSGGAVRRGGGESAVYGQQGHEWPLKKFAKEPFPDAKSDLSPCFIERFLRLAASQAASAAMVTPFTWMFLSSYEAAPDVLLEAKPFNHSSSGNTNAFFDGICARSALLVLENVPHAGM